MTSACRASITVTEVVYSCTQKKGVKPHARLTVRDLRAGLWLAPATQVVARIDGQLSRVTRPT